MELVIYKKKKKKFWIYMLMKFFQGHILVKHLLLMNGKIGY